MYCFSFGLDVIYSKGSFTLQRANSCLGDETAICIQSVLIASLLILEVRYVLSRGSEYQISDSFSKQSFLDNAMT